MSVKDLIEQYKQGDIAYPQLVEQLAAHEYSDPTDEDRAAEGNDWGKVYQRAEDTPDDDSFFWVEAAADDDTLTCDQVDEIVDAIDHYHSQRGAQ